MGRRPITIRQSLIRNVVLLIGLTAAVLIATTLFVGFRAVERVSRDRIENRTTQTEQELERFFGAVRKHALVARGWAERGMLDPRDHEAMNRLFVPVLEQTPYLSSMMVADTNGDGYLLLRDPLDPHAWMNRASRADEWGSRVLRRRWNSLTGEVEEGFVELEYDVRRRVWFQGALTTGPGNEVHWTPPVIFFTTKDPGITAGTHHVSADGTGPTQVVAFDLLLLDISRFTTNLQVSENGKAFVLVEDKDADTLRVLGLPCDDCFSDDASIREALVFVPPQDAVADTKAQLPRADTFGVEPVADILEAWNAAGRSREPLELESGGERWWAGLRPYELDTNTFWIAVAVPERDFLGDVKARSLRIALIALGALLIAVIMAIRMARRYGDPLERLAEASHRIRTLDLTSPGTTESHLVEISDLAEAQRQMVSALQSFSRYVPADVVRELVRRGEVAQIGGSAVDLTVLFTDIAGFTRISEGMTPVALTEHMAEYFEAMIETLQDHGATVDKLVGDAIVAFWGAPNPQADHSERAVNAVLACRDRLATLNRGWAERDRPELPTRFGLATGPVVVGNIGARSRLAYTVLGDTVNLASRLEGMNKGYGTHLLADETVHDACGDAFVWRRLDRVVVLGKTTPVFLYEILGTPETTPDAVRKAARAYEAAWDAYAARDFAGALSRLDALSPDGTVTRLAALCRRLLDEPPGEDWDAVTQMTRK